MARCSITIDGYQIPSMAQAAGSKDVEAARTSEARDFQLRITVERDGKHVHVWTLGDD